MFFVLFLFWKDQPILSAKCDVMCDFRNKMINGFREKCVNQNLFIHSNVFNFAEFIVEMMRSFFFLYLFLFLREYFLSANFSIHELFTLECRLCFWSGKNYFHICTKSILAANQWRMQWHRVCRVVRWSVEMIVRKNVNIVWHIRQSHSSLIEHTFYLELWIPLFASSSFFVLFFKSFAFVYTYFTCEIRVKICDSIEIVWCKRKTYWKAS